MRDSDLTKKTPHKHIQKNFGGKTIAVSPKFIQFNFIVIILDKFCVGN